MVRDRIFVYFPKPENQIQNTGVYKDRAQNAGIRETGIHRAIHIKNACGPREGLYASAATGWPAAAAPPSAAMYEGGVEWW